MKHHLLLSLFFVTFIGYCQPKRIVFNYDTAGNQTKRVICLTCSARIVNDTIQTPKTIETLTKEDLIKDDNYDQISYYPNPVLEELYVKWTNDDKSYVAKIELYNMSGQILKSFSDLRRTEMTAISFNSYPQGLYHVILIYNNGEKRTLKVVKK